MGKHVHIPPVVRSDKPPIPRPRHESEPVLTPIDPELAAVATVGGLRDFFKREYAASKQRGDKSPVPMLGQLLDRVQVRKEFGHVAVAAILSLAHNALPDAAYPANHEAAIEAGKQIFGQLDDEEQQIRTGIDQEIDPHKRGEIRKAAAGLRDPAVQIGHRILELLPGQGFRDACGVVNDAVTALEFAAIQPHPNLANDDPATA